MTSISALDQAPTRGDDEPGAALRRTADLAGHVERLGFRRFWIAEHHAMSGVASAAPEVMIAHVAAATERIRVGSGAVLLPNHRPLHVAEQFQTLEALHPGRIDLGIGRSEGAVDEATVRAFARPDGSAHGAGYEDQLAELLAFGGVSPLPDDHPLVGVRATPADVALPPVVLLGSSEGSARTAAALGVPYAFAAYTNPDVVADAMAVYRDAFVPRHEGDRPHAILGLKVVVGEDDEHARALNAPWHLSLVRLRAGVPAPFVPTDEALAHTFTDAEAEAESQVDVRADAIGGPDHVRAVIDRLLAETGADEVIVSTNTYEAADRAASYERLARAVGLRADGSTDL